MYILRVKVNGYGAMTVRYSIKEAWKSSIDKMNVKLVLPSSGEMFMIMTAMIPLIVAGGAMGAAPVILLTGILGVITVESKVFWDLRKANIKGQKYKLRFIVDPSGY